MTKFLDMDGEKDLEKLLAGCSPVLSASEFVFVSFPGSRYGGHPELSPIAFIVEDEGATLVVPRSEADAHQISYQSVFKRITLNIHSSLEAVGLTAAVSRALSDLGISANVIAGFFHDHIFVPSAVAGEALSALENLFSETMPETKPGGQDEIVQSAPSG
ncbi:ACT domain-containing protein (plasmid) [Verrucomicrobiaceae bacterium 227]